MITAMGRTIDGIQRFGFSVLEFTEDCLGESFELEISGFKVTLTIPTTQDRLPEGARSTVESWLRTNWPNSYTGYEESLLNAEKMKEASDIYFRRLFHLPINPDRSKRVVGTASTREPSVRNEAGSVINLYGQAIGNVNTVHFSAPYDEDSTLASVADALSEAMDIWAANLYQWVFLSTTNDVIALVKKNPWLDNLKVPREAISGPSGLYGSRTHLRQGKPLTREVFEWCAQSAANGPVPDAWKYIREARALISQGEYRLAVIDACTAVELALTAVIDVKLTALQCDSVRELLFARSRGVWALRRLVGDLGCDEQAGGGELLEKIKNVVANPRNRASHGGIDVGPNKALLVLDVATQVVSAAHPCLTNAPPS
ncbi:hypothetical protein [Mycobacteroides abscessus]|uniref:hypothetical protein n=1 Tax=Mycobacteroides abscessus TaxID=36809 RepID=UPI00105062E4|nr:hypothetical protein [Mycobacteroides abscessus]